MKKFFAGLLVFIILVVYPLTMLTTVVRYSIFKPTVVKQIIRASQVGEQLPTLLSDSIAERNAEDGQTVTTDQFVHSTLTPTDIYTVTDQIVDVTALWLGTNKPIEEMDLHISTAPLKSKLLAGSQGETNLDFIPDELTMQDLLQQNDRFDADALAQWNKTVNQLRSSVRSLFRWMWIGWGLITFCLLGIILLRRTPVYGIFGWLGWTTLLITLESIPLVLMVWLAPGWILPWISDLADQEVVAMLNAALGAVMHHLLIPLCWVTGGTALLSVLWFIFRVVLKRRAH